MSKNYITIGFVLFLHVNLINTKKSCVSLGLAASTAFFCSTDILRSSKPFVAIFHPLIRLLQLVPYPYIGLPKNPNYSFDPPILIFMVYFLTSFETNLLFVCPLQSSYCSDVAGFLNKNSY